MSSRFHVIYRRRVTDYPPGSADEDAINILPPLHLTPRHLGVRAFLIGLRSSHLQDLALQQPPPVDEAMQPEPEEQEHAPPVEELQPKEEEVLQNVRIVIACLQPTGGATQSKQG